MKKLSPTQQALYDAMRRGQRVLFMDGFDSYYWRTDNYSRCTKQIRALLESGLVEKYDEVSHSNAHKVRVKPKP